MTNKKKSNGSAPKFERSGRVRPHSFLILELSETSTLSSPNLGLRKKTITDNIFILDTTLYLFLHRYQWEKVTKPLQRVFDWDPVSSPWRRVPSIVPPQ